MSTAAPTQWKTLPAPDSPEAWIERAAEVAAILATDAAARDRAGATPYTEVQLLKDSGLVTLLGPAGHGGGGQDWTTAYRVIREVAKADGSIGQLLGYHYLWNWAARLVGTREQWEHVEAEAVRHTWFFGGAVNPRDSDVVVTEDGDDLVFTGAKTFSTGSRVSDVTVLEGVLEGTDRHIFAIVPSDSPGLTFHDDWDNIGQRLTESGGVTLAGVRTPWASAAGYVDKEFRPRVYNTLNVPTIQLVFISFYLGIAAGALETAATYTRTKTRSWLHGGYDKAVDEPYVIDTYGDLTAKLWAVEALADAVAAEGQKLHDAPDEVTEQARGEFEVRVAAAKARATDVALEVTSRIFEVTGARATASAEGLDRFWRNVRTHTLHDPVAYKRREVGRHVLTGELPEPTWYS
ncbi:MULTISPECIES: acyl-CoA dehydrogenase family protein [Streptomyces]|uniref:acyl-CoA dehydrogenase family protein n=1 Tax=Streptomyces TaxID=1883 RepID=UPI0006AD430B|nr:MULTISPECIES: acyl-CoA dehydrogenase family protein [Streptomyces]ALC30563.1 monooxygenase [Streptomyces sp. CFMR 7]MBT3075260.1 acyl-CoA dehydrogenase family protein [Streptomyces sp. COG21]MBT3084260.1 acyl-CoA dehydrogenase family protein [Streptomyces sp. COG20]MBT3090989.1 acyl-CoA dehydrogenase family protein [Streptomyces sp. CYG21]MBT3099321.1 acyl-CoA dehydrogenase family protein [Streptomyces sp. CBG30]